MKLLSPLDRCSALAVVNDFSFSFFHYWFIFSYVTETKPSQECLFIEQCLVHFLMLFGMCEHVHSTTKSEQKKGCLSVMYQKRLIKGLFALVYMQCIPPMAICYLIVAVSKCM